MSWEKAGALQRDAADVALLRCVGREMALYGVRLRRSFDKSVRIGNFQEAVDVRGLCENAEYPGDRLELYSVKRPMLFAGSALRGHLRKRSMRGLSENAEYPERRLERCGVKRRRSFNESESRKPSESGNRCERVF